MLKKILIALLLTGNVQSIWSQSAAKISNINSNFNLAATNILESKSIPDELETRIKMVTNRIAFGDEPRLTEDFLLACVTLDPQFSRRFTEYSGDQCGRYLSAFSGIEVPGNPVNLKDLAAKIIMTQKADGRFGNDQLNFEDPMKLEGIHMALLWGNGRLLTGLMDYYAMSKDPAVLQSAIKLGNFMLKTSRICSQEAVVERFKTMGAMGFICFTQITDGLVKLYEHTSDKNYLQSASTIYLLLPPLGNQHSHGFLNTLLGVMRLYQATKEKKHLEYVERIYQQVLDAPDFLISGGVPEFFDASGTSPGSRDEGCSEADFIMVSLELWKSTGKVKYLENAEYCLYNELMYNQFDSGDFGSHPIRKNFGFEVSTSAGRCWWCCDYHGLQAMLEAKKIIITSENERKLVNLYAYSKYSDPDLVMTLFKIPGERATYALRIDSCKNTSSAIALRIPSWSKNISLMLNGKMIKGKTENGYLLLNQIWTKGDLLKITLDYQLKLTTPDRHIYSLGEAPAALKKAALQYGPYLLSADDGYSPSFLAEPSGKNVIYLPYNLNKISTPGQLSGSTLKDGYLELSYRHDGYYTIDKITLRPMSEVSYGHPANVQLWFNFEKK